MTKKAYKYLLTLEAKDAEKLQAASHKTLNVEFENHDDLFKIIDLAKSKKLFENENHSIEFSLGLKLFSEIILKHKDHPLFTEMKPAIVQFMNKLKQA